MFPRALATKTVVDKPLKKILPGTPEMESLLAIGYPDIGTRKKAEAILKERKENPALWPYEVAQRAEAFLQALDATPKVIDTDPGIRST
ncbi:hypothetical protein CCP3SC15_6710003 [Gammaproteobacteria bacterium]